MRRSKSDILPLANKNKKDSDSNIEVYVSESRVMKERWVAKLNKTNAKSHYSYVVIPSLTEARWIIDTRFIFNSAAIKPSSYKARIALIMFRLLWSIGLKRIIFPARINIISKDKNRPFARLKSMLHEQEYIGCFYFGAVGPLQKITLEISSKNKCTGYIKLASSQLARLKLNNEINALSYMHGKGIECIELPDHTGLNEISGAGNYLAFRQTAVSSSYVPNGVSSQIFKCLSEIAIETIDDDPFKANKYLNGLRYKLSTTGKLMETLLGEDLMVVIKHIEEMINHSDNLMMTFSHGDFTRWNIRLKEEDLCIFDWEEANFRPLSHDLFHFIFAECVLVQKELHFSAFYRKSSSGFSKTWLCDCRSLLNDYRFDDYLYLYLLWLTSYYLNMVMSDSTGKFLNDKSNAKVIEFLKSGYKYFAVKKYYWSNNVNFIN